MPNVVCPGCQTLLSYDPREATEFACPQCSQRLRVAPPKPRPAPPVAAAPRIPVARPAPPRVEENVEEEEEEEEEEEAPARRKKKRSKRSARVSPLLLPLGGVAALLFVFGWPAFVASAAGRKDPGAGGVVFVVMLVIACLHMAIGAAALTWAVNSMASRKRVPSIEYFESLCLYPILVMAGLLGMLPPTLLFIPLLAAEANGNPPAIDRISIVPVVLLSIFSLLCWLAAASGAVKLLLNTSWRDAAGIVVRYVSILIVLGMALGLTAGLLGAIFAGAGR